MQVFIQLFLLTSAFFFVPSEGLEPSHYYYFMLASNASVSTYFTKRAYNSYIRAYSFVASKLGQAFGAKSLWLYILADGYFFFNSFKSLSRASFYC